MAPELVAAVARGLRDGLGIDAAASAAGVEHRAVADLMEAWVDWQGRTPMSQDALDGYDLIEALVSGSRPSRPACRLPPLLLFPLQESETESATGNTAGRG